jgi:hypothetical protein
MMFSNLIKQLLLIIVMVPPWFLVVVILSFLAVLVLLRNRDKKWILCVWLPLMVVAIGGSVYFSYAVLLLSSVPNGPEGGFVGLGLVLIALVCSPFLLLLFICLRFRPRHLASPEPK